MQAGLALQYVVVALAVLLAAWVVMKKQFPQATRRLRVAIAVPMVRERRPAWLRRLGIRIAPPGMAGGDGCGGCNGCG
ncbi:MAG TPA: DUF6587 family protein [Luteimonas sp.]|nr:DUF6587 family protein [Luteimonas sp.]